MSAPLAVVLAAPGTNRDGDVALALELAGAQVRTTLVDELRDDAAAALRDASIVVVAGGFSHADALGAGRVLALDLELAAGDALRDHVARGGLVIGICNGFQALVRAGLLPGALGHNASGRFQCEWVELRPEPASRCAWTAGLAPIECPIAHGEGRYVHPDPAGLAADGLVALRYASDPNGSVDGIAGVCDPTGRVLGLMPHPENHVLPRQHPSRRSTTTLGLRLFERGVALARAA